MSLAKTATGAINQMMCVDGTTAVLDAIHPATPFDMEGGVGNDDFVGTTDGNFHLPIATGLLGAQAPVIAAGAANLITAGVLSDDNDSFEGGTVGNWTASAGAVANSSAWSAHGSKCLKLSHSASAAAIFLTTGLPESVPYVASATVRVVAGSARIGFYDSVGDWRYGNTIAVGNTGITSVTFTPEALSGLKQIWIESAGAGACEVYIDAVMFEAGTQTPFCVASRTACTMTIPTATIGLTAGMPFSAMFVINTPHTGDVATYHQIFDVGSAATQDRINCYKDGADKKIYFIVYDHTAGSYKACTSAAMTALTWAANTNHILILTRSSAGVLGAYWNGTVFAILNGGAGTGLETTVSANAFFGTHYGSAQHLNGAILPAIWGRVLSAGEIAALSAPATWASVIDLPQITVTGLDTGNAVRLYDSAGNVHASAVEAGGTATLTYTLD